MIVASANAQPASTTGNETTHPSGTQTDGPPPAGNPKQGTYGNPGMATPCNTMEGGAIKGTPGTRTATGGCRSSTNKNKNGYPKSNYDTGTASPSTQQPQ
jgi:hypothetical protein